MHSMNDPTSALAGMLPFESIGLYEQPKPRFIFKMPRVVPDQKSKFESDELFRRLSRESEVGEINKKRPESDDLSPLLGKKSLGLACEYS
ncbi:CBF beta domain containing protein [Asbolus verrucosus]|uniref:CBF beta domain containing protein n=1 Tax=Asbolus verrucosus TaxID=1661398 RepID=A0A482VAX5_ASBVE|nr:CBF beta domain containing protein [Asbolus verrucosus]